MKNFRISYQQQTEAIESELNPAHNDGYNYTEIITYQQAESKDEVLEMYCGVEGIKDFSIKEVAENNI